MLLEYVEKIIYTHCHIVDRIARVKGGIKKTYYPPSQKVIGNREVDTMYVVENSCNSTCSSFTIKFFTFSGFNHWNNFVIILYEIPSTRSWYKQSRQNKTIFFKPTKNLYKSKKREGK